jgi:hypothetical protein
VKVEAHEVPTPEFIFCPRCGSRMRMERVADPSALARLKERGFAAACEGTCPCGVAAVLAVRKMPSSPTFTLMFNIYRLEKGGGRG